MTLTDPRSAPPMYRQEAWDALLAGYPAPAVAERRLYPLLTVAVLLAAIPLLLLTL